MKTLRSEIIQTEFKVNQAYKAPVCKNLFIDIKSWACILNKLYKNLGSEVGGGMQTKPVCTYPY